MQRDAARDTDSARGRRRTSRSASAWGQGAATRRQQPVGQSVLTARSLPPDRASVPGCSRVGPKQEPEGERRRAVAQHFAAALGLELRLYLQRCREVCKERRGPAADERAPNIGERREGRVRSAAAQVGRPRAAVSRQQCSRNTACIIRSDRPSRSRRRSLRRCRRTFMGGASMIPGRVSGECTCEGRLAWRGAASRSGAWRVCVAPFQRESSRVRASRSQRRT